MDPTVPAPPVILSPDIGIETPAPARWSNAGGSEESLSSAEVPENPDRRASIISTSDQHAHGDADANGNGNGNGSGSGNASASKEKERERERERATVPSACVQCRSKHLKCDGLSPCTRCSSNSYECIYVRSRRGFKGPRRNGTPGKPMPVAGNVDRSCPLVYPAARNTPNVANGLATPPETRLMTLAEPGVVPLYDLSQEIVSFEPRPMPPGTDLRERCIEAFFYHFHPAHPFILPRKSYFALRKEKPLDHLDAALRYVGSFYVPQAPTVALGLEAERIIYDSACPKDEFRVQAMLILVIGLDGYTYQEKALSILIEAQDLAMELGMNKREYAYLNGNGSNMLEESWRRTWWELYIVDGMIAGVHQKSNFRMKDIPADVALPCEEKEYASGVSAMRGISKHQKY